ncbi:MAG: RNA polymerase sigma factor [Candidatus Eisenbacteria bacterium]|nr:RNA polymerase sigma factor [Candidatus Eisenbacteria bacterium]
MQDCSEDIALARSAADGEESAWERILDRTGDRLYALLCYQLGDREEAFDLLQETYLQAFRKIRDYRGEAPLETWLRVIAIRKAIDWRRTVLRRLRRNVPLEEAALPLSLPATGVWHDARLREARRALGLLSRVQRACFLLHEWEGFSFREVGAMLGCGEGTARVHASRARKKLRRILGMELRAIATGTAEGQAR